MKSIFIFLTLLLTPLTFAVAHVIPQSTTPTATFIEYLYQGVRHIIPLGLDHILFITTVFLLSKSFTQVIRHSLIFTLAHSVTLTLVILGVFAAPPEIVEPVIALSILILAIDIIRPFIWPAAQSAVIFIFGLFHGMGFAGVLSEVGLPESDLFVSLFGFNIGVEIGQLMVVTILYFATLLPFNREQTRRSISYAAAALIAVTAAFWFLERVFF
jgi:hydrogenase/urease accessory protein HupE